MDDQNKPEILNAPEQHMYHIQDEDDVSKALSLAININDNKIMHEPTCAICSSVNRKEIEEKYSETKNAKEVAALAKELFNLKLSKTVIENHILFHTTGGIREIQKVEYVGKINRLNNVNLTTLERIKLGLSAINERLVAINSIMPSGDISFSEIEKIKSSETARLMSSMTNLLRLQANILGEMKNSGEIVTIPKREFIDTFHNALLSCETEETRRVIKGILDRLAKLSAESQ